MSGNSISAGQESDLQSLSIEEKIAAGVAKREDMDFDGGFELLYAAWVEARDAKDQTHLVEVTNQFSILYRLMAGAEARQSLEGYNRLYPESHHELQALTYSSMSLDIYIGLDDLGYLDLLNPVIARNLSHALLYAGYVFQAGGVLEWSIEVQTSQASKGDELVHLAAAVAEINRADASGYVEARSILSQGMELLKVDGGSPIAITFGLMTESMVASLEEDADAAKAKLYEALSIAEEHNLKVRMAEIDFLIRRLELSLTVNVFDAISGFLYRKRRYMLYEMGALDELKRMIELKS